VQQFSVAVFEAVGDGHIDQHMQCTSDMKKKLRKILNFKMLTNMHVT
jgi:hypothetical protein